MAHKTVKGKSFVWHHFPELKESDFSVLEKQYKFHPLDFDDLREDAELPKVDVYKYYVFATIAVPVYHVETDRVSKQNLAIFIGPNYVVTVAREPMESVDRFFARATRSTGLRKDALGQSPGYFVYKLLDYVFRDAKVILHELSRATQTMEGEVYDRHSRGTTRKLGLLRRNLLFLRHIIDPQRLLIGHFVSAGKKFIPASTEVYFDDVRDTLDGMWVVAENLKNIVDGLFDVNEALLSHRTNQIIRLLTVISVVLMPPTLVTSFYGMNVAGLPYAGDIARVSLIVLGSLLAFLAIILIIDRRK